MAPPRDACRSTAVVKKGTLRVNDYTTKLLILQVKLQNGENFKVDFQTQ